MCQGEKLDTLEIMCGKCSWNVQSHTIKGHFLGWITTELLETSYLEFQHLNNILGQSLQSH